MKLKIFFIFALLSLTNPLNAGLNEVNKFTNNENNSLLKPKQSSSKVLNLGESYLDSKPLNEYILGAGDTLQIDVSKDYPELNQLVTITGEGIIVLPIIGEKYVEKLSLSELTSYLNKVYSEYVKYPDITVTVRQYRNIKFLIKGEVVNPGIHVINGQIMQSNENSSTPIGFPTLFDAIRKSGGITPYSDLTNVEVTRLDTLSNGGGRKRAVIDFSKLLSIGSPEQNLRIYDSDVISIRKLKSPNEDSLKNAVSSNLNPKLIRVFVTGRVNRGGEKMLTKAATLNDAITMSGGARIIRGNVIFVRINSDGSLDSRNIAYRKNAKRGSKNNPFLQEFDLVYVRGNALTGTTQILEEIAAPFKAVLESYGLYKIISD